MGYTLYDDSSKEFKARRATYASSSRGETFSQSKKKEVHESMNPKSIKVRECLDSVEHPNTFPIIFAMDETGSMMGIPEYLVKTGLPKIMGSIIQKGVPDASLLFLGIGDHECDNYPLQVAQFESGDAELDMWLTRTYLEGNGGGNAGESYMLAWYFAAFHTKLDSLDKRGKKGLLVTCGDEPCLPNLPLHAIKGLMDHGIYKTFTTEELLEEVQKKYDVYHLHMMHGRDRADNPNDRRAQAQVYWKHILGQNCILIKNESDVASEVIRLALMHAASPSQIKSLQSPPKEEEGSQEGIQML